jgi:hypothetical protein
MGDEEVLQDEPHRRVVRVGNTVRRPMHPWSDTIHELLRHLEAVGFPYSPRVLGIDSDGREILTYIGGESGPAGWAKVVDDAGLVAMARLLRDYHNAVAGFRPRTKAFWAGRAGPPAEGELICHGDFGPWNLVWQGHRAVGILDWDYAWPSQAVHDVAYALEYVVPFRDYGECRRSLRYSAPPARQRRLERFAEAYGLSSTAGLVDEVINQQQLVLNRARQLAADGREPQVTWHVDGLLDGVAKRIRWSRRHRHLFEQRMLFTGAAEASPP